MSTPITSALSSSFTGLATPPGGLLSSSPSRTAREGRDTSAFASASSQQRDASAAPIICICHLSWDWVWQRPQQYLSRFAKRHPVLFVETYCADTEKTYTKSYVADGHPNVTVLQVHLPRGRWQDGAFIDSERRRAVIDAMKGELKGRFDHALLWFYDPMAVKSFAGQLNERLIVYDCMDELSQFRGAPPELLARERELLRQADVVFCGGRKMRDKRLPLNSNCHFFGTGVDIEHFGKALSPKLPIAPEIDKLSKPVLGYFGVVDERIDYELLAKLADARPDWSIVMVGPTAKVDPKEFPQRHNLHWLGGRPYADLPAITKGFSVCLMPFARNEATEYINPTKALEYMATGRPVVSTALDEVKMNFGTVARVAESHEEFITSCLREAFSPTQRRVLRGLRLAEENTWDANCAKMEQHIATALAARQKASARSARAEKVTPFPGTGLAYV